MERYDTTDNRIWKGTIGVLVLICLLVLGALSGKMFETVDAGEIVVIQHPFDGELEVFSSPGLFYQHFGKATHYKKSFQFWFSSQTDQGSTANQAIKIRFNDGGHADISGSVRADLPSILDQVKDIHVRLGSQMAVEQEMVRTVIEKSVYMSGPLMSSKESYAEKRNLLITYIEDQASGGVYKTIPREVKIKDPMTEVEKTVTIVEIALDEKGSPQRQEASPLQRFGIRLYNLSINDIKYDQLIEQQISAQQQAIMSVQTAMAEAKKAEQRAITAAKEGEANAAKAKWEQETIKAKAVVEAQQRLEVADLDRQAAEQKKQEQILLGTGEAERKRLVMSADGALTQKLESWVKVNELYATSISNYKGAWVPSIIMGGGNAGNGYPGMGAQDFINFLMMHSAKQLSLDMNVPTGARPPQ